jgi:hypothetical protein
MGMYRQAECSNQEHLRATAAELQTLADLVERYPAEAQLIMAALEDGLTLGPMRVAGDSGAEAGSGGVVR